MDEIVVGVDESATARVAAVQAAELAQATGRTLHLVMALKKKASTTSVQTGGHETVVVDHLSIAEDFLRSLKGELPNGGAATHAIVNRDPADALVHEAERLEASVNVVGNRRVQSAARVLGTIALDVAKQAPCNVYIVHTTG
jgi:nucleotide-binding universal stress UspA family protein